MKKTKLDTVFFLSDGKPSIGQVRRYRADPRRGGSASIKVYQIVIHAIAIGQFQKEFLRSLAIAERWRVRRSWLLTSRVRTPSCWVTAWRCWAVSRMLASISSTSIRRSTPGRSAHRPELRTVRDDEGDRVGFSRASGTARSPSAPESYGDSRSTTSSNSWRRGSRRSTGSWPPTGSLFLHLDYRETHYCKVALDGIFGRDSFLNEIIWAYDYGGPPQDEVAHEARQHPLVREEHPTDYTFRFRCDRSHPLHGSRSSSAPRKPRGGRPRPMSGGTRSSRRAERNARDIRTQKPLGVLNAIGERALEEAERPGLGLFRGERNDRARRQPDSVGEFIVGDTKRRGSGDHARRAWGSRSRASSGLRDAGAAAAEGNQAGEG